MQEVVLACSRWYWCAAGGVGVRRWWRRAGGCVGEQEVVLACMRCWRARDGVGVQEVVLVCGRWCWRAGGGGGGEQEVVLACRRWCWQPGGGGGVQEVVLACTPGVHISALQV